MGLLHRIAARPKLVALAVLALAVAAVVAYPTFAPRATLAVDQALPQAEAYTELARGTFRDGAPGHTASGTVRLLQGPEGHLLRFEGYQATSGPDVYFYLTFGPDPQRTEEVESGLRVLVPGGADDGEATLRGTFNVPLPAGVDYARFRGVAAWCDNFNVLFGSAALA